MYLFIYVYLLELDWQCSISPKFEVRKNENAVVLVQKCVNTIRRILTVLAKNNGQVYYAFNHTRSSSTETTPSLFMSICFSM